MSKKSILEDLFVLELANNHNGCLDRGLQIISQFSQVVRSNNIKAAIKLQLRDVDNFIHKEHRNRQDIRYISRVEQTRITFPEIQKMVEAIRNQGCLTCVTPFDEVSVERCRELNLDLIKLASSDINAWSLIEKIVELEKPVLFSTGGADNRSIEQLVAFFEKRGVEYGINHCVSIYPTEDEDLELNQLDYLKKLCPNGVLGLSTHEYHSWDASMYIAYAKGALTFERHIDIEKDGEAVSPYCSLPHQIDSWFKVYQKAKIMCGGGKDIRRVISSEEKYYLEQLVRGVYLKRDLPKGYIISQKESEKDFYLAITRIKGQLSCLKTLNGEVINRDLKKDQALEIDDIKSPPPPPPKF